MTIIYHNRRITQKMGCTIKNKHELVLRAKAHARADRIIQGTYGRGSVNGKVEFEGCFIGCLAAPHRKRALRAWVEGFLGNYVEDEFALPELLHEEFGIVPELSRACETIFEEMEYHGDAINFLPAFAEALPEGKRITPRQVNSAWERITGHEIGMGPYFLSTHTEAEDARDELLTWLRGRA